ncbi:SEC10/PgrA surface exclusion domain-containing protein [Limosilactobacillus oris]|uniref:SEC10/PgrA surface exclusion domain-containing protein n=1 Tax=Limosilactobacillus oris TaxID=1632 RepID=UPI0021B355FE|nr:SEC10/PgrA surface exclusion domain-containing protein [Limosilactobacillus oris]UXC66581.1 SEC10/PgrA surface exclusion domain-containing protein [Limosilactobacillus oris]
MTTLHSNKKAVALAAAAAAVTGGTMAVTDNVHADTVNTQDNTQNQTQNPQASDLKTQQDASRQAYADANKANTDAQSNLAQASAKNTTAQGNVDSAQTDVDTATQKVQSATTAEQNTQAEVTQAQTEAKKAQNDYDNAVKQQAQTDQAVHQAQSDLKTANQAVSEAQKAADQADAKQAQAQTNANTANQNVENTNTQVQKAQGAVNDAQASVKNAENDVQTAQNHDQVVAQDQNNVQAKTDAKQAADAKVNDAQKVNDEKIEAQSNAQKTVDQLSKDTNADLSGNTHLNMSQQWINTVKGAYQDALKQNTNAQTSLDFETDALKKAFGTNIPGANKLNHYTNDPALQAIPLKLENGRLSASQELDATRYYLTLVNQIQEALGTPQQKITSQSLKDATKVVNQYIADNWIVIENGHDDNALKSTRMSEAMGENYININNGPLTMNDLHKAIFDQVTNMLFNPQGDWKHAMIVANAYGQFAGTTAGVQLNFEPNSNQGGLFDRLNFHGAGVLHFLSNTDAPKDAQYIAIDPSQQEAVDKAGNTLNQAQANYDNFIKNNQSSDLDLAHIVSQQDYQNNKAKYDADPNGAWAPTYKATVDQYNKQQAALKPYLDAIDQAQNKLDQVYFTKTSDSSKTDDHAAQLANAKQALQDAQAKLETAKQEASQASADLANAKADAKTAANDLKAAQDKLAHDSSSSVSLADAQEALKNAKAVLTQKQVNLADAKKAAQKAQTMKSQSDSALASAKQESQAAQKALADAQAKAKSAQEKVDALTNDDQAVADAKDKLNAANQKLQVAKSNHETAQDNLTKAQNELKQAQTKLENAKDEATKAANALKDAQAKADKTKDALAKAKAGLITDNKVYGDSVAIKDQTIHAGEINKIVDPEIANPMATDPTQNLVMGAFLQMATSKLDTIPTGTTASWSDLNTLNHDANTVGDHSEDVLVTFPDGSTTTVKMNLHVLATVKPSQPDTPVVNPGHDQTTTPTDPTDQPGHNVKPGDTTKPASKPSTEPSTTPSHEEQQPGTHTDTPTAKPSDQQPSTQPSGNQGQTKADHNVTVAPSENGSQTAVTNNNVKLVANEVGNNNTLKRSDLNNGKLPQTGNHSEAGLIGLGVASMMAMFGLISTQCREN